MRKPKNAIEAARLGLTFDEETGEVIPTAATPGSPEKISVMADRVSKGLPIHVPGDRRLRQRLWVYDVAESMEGDESCQD